MFIADSSSFSKFLHSNRLLFYLVLTGIDCFWNHAVSSSQKFSMSPSSDSLRCINLKDFNRSLEILFLLSLLRQKLIRDALCCLLTYENVLRYIYFSHGLAVQNMSWIVVHNLSLFFFVMFVSVGWHGAPWVVLIYSVSTFSLLFLWQEDVRMLRIEDQFFLKVNRNCVIEILIFQLFSLFIKKRCISDGIFLCICH